MGQHKYTVQMAAESEPAVAVSKATALEAGGLKDVFIFKARVGAKTYNRVCVGLFDSASDARAFLEGDIKNKTHTEGFIQVLR